MDVISDSLPVLGHCVLSPASEENTVLHRLPTQFRLTPYTYSVYFRIYIFLRLNIFHCLVKKLYMT